jgi:hypothetical protein
MKKVVFRYGLILLFACLVAYGMYWVVQNNSAALGLNMAGFREHGGFPASDGEGAAFRAQPPGDFEGRGRGMEHDQVSLLPGLIGIARNIGIIAGITLFVVFLQRALRPLFRRGKLHSTM